MAMEAGTTGDNLSQKFPEARELSSPSSKEYSGKKTLHLQALNTCAFISKILKPMYSLMMLDTGLLTYFFSEYVSLDDFLSLSMTCKRFRQIFLTKNGVCDKLIFNISPILQICNKKIQTLLFYEEIVKAKKQFMVSCGEAHTVITVKDQVFTFGGGESGQLGFGDTNDSLEARSIPIPGLPSIKSVVGGGKHTIVLTKCGQIFGFGDNSTGALGPNLERDKILLPTNLEFCNENISMISCAKNYTAIVLADEVGTVIILSDSVNHNFQLVQYKNTHFNCLRRGQIPQNERITDVSAGFEHILMLSSTGKVYAVGNNSFGQLGIDTESLLETDPVQVQTYNFRVAQVAAGAAHSMLLTKNGKLFTWGNGRKGQLGNGKFSIERLPIEIKLPNQCFPIIITCGNNHSVILDLEANVLTCGANEFGQTAALSNFFQVNRPSVVRAGQFAKGLQQRNLFHIAAGKGHTAVLGRDSNLFMFGQTEKCGGGGFIRQHSHRTAPVKVTLHGCVSIGKKNIQYYSTRYRKQHRI